MTILVNTLAETPQQGISLGNSFYKIRLAIATKGKGKNGGARVITYLKVIAFTVYPAAIYAKGEKGTISDRELKSIFKAIP